MVLNRDMAAETISTNTNPAKAGERRPPMGFVTVTTVRPVRMHGYTIPAGTPAHVSGLTQQVETWLPEQPVMVSAVLNDGRRVGFPLNRVRKAQQEDLLTSFEVERV